MGQVAGLAAGMSVDRLATLLDSELGAAALAAGSDPDAASAGRVFSTTALASSWFDCPREWRFRVLGGATRGRLAGGDGYEGYRLTNYSGLLGIERARGGVLVGVGGGWGRTRTESRNLGDKSRSNEYGLMLYGRYDLPNGMFVSGRVGYTFSDVTYDRHLPMFGKTAKGDFDAHYFTGGLTVGGAAELAGWRLAPTAGLNWLGTRGESYREHQAGIYNLRHDGIRRDSLEGRLGLGVSRRFAPAGQAVVALTPRLAVGGSYEFADRTVISHGRFAGASVLPHYKATTRRPDRLGGHVEAGLEVQLTQRVSVGYRFSGRKHYTEHSGGVNLGLSW